MNMQQFQPEITTHRVKKHYRARGSRGGARKKKQAAARARAEQAQAQAGFLAGQQSSYYYPSASNFPHPNHHINNASGNRSSYGIVYPYQRHEDHRQLPSMPDSRMTQANKVHITPAVGDDSHNQHPHHTHDIHVSDYTYENSQKSAPYAWNGNNATKNTFRAHSSDQSISSSIPTVGLSSSSSHSLACSEISDALSDNGCDGDDDIIPKDECLSTKDSEEGTILSKSSSASISSMQRKRVTVPIVSSYSSTSSLFVTSPKSFLMGKTSAVVPAQSDEMIKQRLTY